MKKILFLDHDGVICLLSEWGSRHKTKSLFDRFNQKAIEVLNDILKETDCEIVVSSDWRAHCTLEEMRQLYQERGVVKSPIDYTTTSLDSHLLTDIKPHNELEMTRCLEIQDWLFNHPEVTHWVAVDDLNLAIGLHNFVQTKRQNEGIKQVGIKQKIINFLK